VALPARADVIGNTAPNDGVGENSSPPAATNAPSKLRSAEDGWLDASAFLDQSFGFIPLVMPITEPAVGYGAAGGLTFIDQPRGEAQAGFGRPNITAVGGLGTQNGTWGVLAADSRHWLDDRLQTLVGVAYASVNLDFYGIGQDGWLRDHPLSYNLEPLGGLVQAKYRLGNSRFAAGLGYALADTQVSFNAPASRSRRACRHRRRAWTASTLASAAEPCWRPRPGIVPWDCSLTLPGSASTPRASIPAPPFPP
jgi:hypothetical protein